MSQYSLDSLDNDPSSDNKFTTKLMKGYSVPSISDEYEESGKHDAAFNEWPEVGVTIQTKDLEKCCENAIIASTGDALGKSSLTEKKLALRLGATSDFRVGRPVAKKFDVARMSSSAEFRHRISPLPCRKGPDGIEGFTKAGKKLGKARLTIVDKDKKTLVSYLELHRRKFGAESRRCILIPEGSAPSIFGRRTNEQASATVSREDESELDFYRRVMEHGIQEPRETRSCEAHDQSEEDEEVSKSSYDVSECFTDVVQPIEQRRRVDYKPYTIEDYKCLCIPRADRSLGPDRVMMESKDLGSEYNSLTSAEISCVNARVTKPLFEFSHRIGKLQARCK